MSSGATAAAPSTPGRPDAVALMDAVQIDWHTTPFRAERFLDQYRPAVSRVLAYGAKGYLFYRSEEDSQHFVHISLWEDRRDFERYWFSQEMQRVRESIAGWYGQPVLPHWSVVIERS